MQLGERIVGMLRGSAGVSDLVGDSIHPVLIPEGRNPPAIVYQVVFGRPLPTVSGPSRSRPVRVQFSCFAQSYAKAHAMADAIEALMSTRAVPGVTLASGPVVSSWTRHDMAAEYQPQWFHVVVDVQMMTLDS